MPGEGFEPPTFGLQNRCTTTVLTRPQWGSTTARLAWKPEAIPLKSLYKLGARSYRGRSPVIANLLDSVDSPHQVRCACADDSCRRAPHFRSWRGADASSTSPWRRSYGREPLGARVVGSPGEGERETVSQVMAPERYRSPAPCQNTCGEVMPRCADHMPREVSRSGTTRGLEALHLVQPDLAALDRHR